MVNENEIMTFEELRETKEMRVLLNLLSRRSKENIIKGIAMFEAGYRTGYLDGLNSLRDKDNFQGNAEFF